MSTVAPGATFALRGTSAGADICSPVKNARPYSGVQVFVPEFRNFHTLLNPSPGSKSVPSGMVTSAQNSARSIPPVATVGAVVVITSDPSSGSRSVMAVGVKDIPSPPGGNGVVVASGLASSVSWASAVCAAAVSTVSGSGVGLASPSAVEQAVTIRHVHIHIPVSLALIRMVMPLFLTFNASRTPDNQIIHWCSICKHF